MSELVVLVDESDSEIGAIEKMAAHRNGGELHRAFSVLIVDQAGNTLLQQRAQSKYHFRGLWANACCGHPRPGEDVLDAARRRLQEEMGIEVDLEHVATFRYEARDPVTGLIEREVDHALVGVFTGQPQLDPSEVQDWRWVPIQWLRDFAAQERGTLAPWVRPLLESVDL